MHEKDDAELLNLFALGESEEAFGALVRRHLSLVHSVALRHTNNPDQAQEITQAVFIILARKARSLGPKIILPGWLYNTARLTAANFRRMEARRMAREQEAYMRSNFDESSSEEAWQELSPLLEEAMANLSEAERDALVLRYFGNKTLHETGSALGIEDRAAQKRVARGLERLRIAFRKRGVASTATMIAAALSTYSVQAAPAALAATITRAAVEGTAVTGTTLTLFKGTLKLMAWTKAKMAAITGVAILLATGTAVITARKHQKNSGISSTTISAIQQANTGLPAAQTQAKMLIFTAMSQKKIPSSGDWCDVLNANHKLWPVTPTNTLFAINSEVANRTYTRQELASGKLPGKTVVFFETAQPGWNQSGGAELAPQKDGSIAVAFADGSSSLVSAAEIASLHWKP
jgi:RNA polymerase sigma factor (sigma-70 family)